MNIGRSAGWSLTGRVSARPAG